MSHHNKQASKPDWRTPQRLLEPARVVFGGQIGIDPATAPDNPTQARVFYTEADNGLVQPWDVEDGLFCNPPWSRKLGLPIAIWLKPLHEFAVTHFATQVIIVTPASTNSSWFHSYLAPGVRPPARRRSHDGRGQLRFCGYLLRP